MSTTYLRILQRSFLFIQIKPLFRYNYSC